MVGKKFLLTICHAASSPLEAVAVLKVASNLKAFDDEADVRVFLLGEGVELVRKGVAAGISLEFEGHTTNLGELLALAVEIGIRFHVCRAFMHGATQESLVEGADIQSSANIAELLLEGYVPFSVNL